jgi:hypothetical protein
MRDWQKELADSLDKSDQIAKLEARVEQLESDALILARRLVLEDESTFAPETLEVMARWKEKALDE